MTVPFCYRWRFDVLFRKNCPNSGRSSLKKLSTFEVLQPCEKKSYDNPPGLVLKGGVSTLTTLSICRSTEFLVAKENFARPVPQVRNLRNSWIFCYTDQSSIDENRDHKLEESAAAFFFTCSLADRSRKIRIMFRVLITWYRVEEVPVPRNAPWNDGHRVWHDEFRRGALWKKIFRIILGPPVLLW